MEDTAVDWHSQFTYGAAYLPPQTPSLTLSPPLFVFLEMFLSFISGHFPASHIGPEERVIPSCQCSKLTKHYWVLCSLIEASFGGCPFSLPVTHCHWNYVTYWWHFLSFCIHIDFM